MKEIPQKYNHKEVEKSWQNQWNSWGCYAWDESLSREKTFVVDTPPPTVSGSLHVGHVFSYTHTDVIVRYQRMCGKNIMYPMGWDDNGLPTERRVQNKFGIKCDPHQPYDKDWKATEVAETDRKSKKRIEFQDVSRQNFIESCAQVTEQDEAAFEDLWRELGLSIDWPQTYATIDTHSRKISQYSFLDLVDKGFVYNSESPTMWDVDYKTALAQADLEDRDRPGNYHDIRFSVEDGGDFIISTTRPELLVSCIAVVAHPDDKRYQNSFGKNAITPLFSAKVPIVPSTHADPEKGTGIMMVCTFGDIADVDWWKSSGLPIKQAIGTDGRMLPVSFDKEPFVSKDVAIASSNYEEIVGKTTKQARVKMAELLQSSGALVGDLKPIEHPVKFYEKGDRPIEFITTRQWFVNVLEHKEALLKQGEKIAWHPHYMRTRFDHWVEGLNHDWCISRQRFFGVPFPVWYPIDDKGKVCYDKPIYADKSSLPVDPLLETPSAYKEDQRGKPGGFSGDPDVMDTWATSSLTPQLVSHWGQDEKRHKKLFPADIRPQSHEIIRTWAFYTIAKAWMHTGEIPWKNVVISGWILDPDRKKMSKSKGNVVTPQHLLEEYSSDAVRYWAARARLGVDTAFDEKVFKNGRKLVTKLFNASKFVISQVDNYVETSGIPDIDQITADLDRALIAKLTGVIKDATKHFEAFEYANALQVTEDAFWLFCDNYVELVKARAYDEQDTIGRASAVATLNWALKTFLRLFAPAMPYITEEIWSWRFSKAGSIRGESVHTTNWPVVDEVSEVSTENTENLLTLSAEILSSIHHAKSLAQKSLRWPVDKLIIKGQPSSCQAARLVSGDISRAGRLRNDALFFKEEVSSATNFEIEVILSETEE